MFYKLNYDTVNMKHDLRCSFRASQVYVHMSIEHSVQSVHIFFLDSLDFYPLICHFLAYYCCCHVKCHQRTF